MSGSSLDVQCTRPALSTSRVTSNHSTKHRRLLQSTLNYVHKRRRSVASLDNTAVLIFGKGEAPLSEAGLPYIAKLSAQDCLPIPEK